MSIDDDTAIAVSFDDIDLDEQNDAPIDSIEPKGDGEQPDVPDTPIDTPDETPAEPEWSPLEAPEFFNKEHKEIFAKLQTLESEEAKQAAQSWLDQYQEHQKFITQKSQAVSEERRQYEQQLNDYNRYQKALEGIMPAWQAQGIDPAVGLSQMAYYGNLLNTDPQALIKEIMNTPQAIQAGLSLDKLVEDQPYIEPHIQEELRNLKLQNQQLQQAHWEFQQGQQNQSAQANLQAVNEFALAKDSEGNPLRPHVQNDSPYIEKVSQEMRYWLESPTSEISKIPNPTDRLQAAYDEAISRVPEIQAEIKKEQERAEAAERHAKAQKAKEASVSTSSKTTDAPKEGKELFKSFDDIDLSVD